MRITYALKSVAKVTFRRKSKTDYNEFRPDHHKYSATLHPGRARLKASQLINTIALFISCTMGIFTDQVPETTKVNYKLISRPEPPTNQRRHSPKETSDPRTFDCPPKADQETPPAPNRQNQSKNKQKTKRNVAENNHTSAAAAARVRTTTLPEVSQKRSKKAAFSS